MGRRTARPALDAVLAEPQVARYLDGWPRADDDGLVAETPEGEAVGAVWWRRFGVSEPGYGFVSDEIPELTVAVARAWRRRGVGTLLLNGALREAAARGVPALSLSVEDRNPARRLYARGGFEIRARNGGAWTMVRTLG